MKLKLYSLNRRLIVCIILLLGTSSPSLNVQAIDRQISETDIADAEQGLNIYPNPAKDVLNINYNPQRAGSIILLLVTLPAEQYSIKI